MSGDRVGALLVEYRKQLHLPWAASIAGAQRVWMLIYPPTLERRIRLKVGEFEAETLAARRRWILVDVSQSFTAWLAGNEYREEYFAEPELLSPALGDFVSVVSDSVRVALESADEQTVVALFGAGTLFPMARLSQVVERVTPAIRGRLLVFFPGQRDGSNYRLLDARDGWDYLAVPIE